MAAISDSPGRVVPTAAPGNAVSHVAALTVVAVLLYWPSLFWLGTQWASVSGTVSHGFLVAAIAIYLLLDTARFVSAGDCHPSWRIVPLLVALNLLWLMGYVADVTAVHTVLVPLILLAGIWTALGAKAMSLAAFPVLYLLFAMPAWEHAAIVFQTVTVHAVHLMVHAINIPVYVDGATVRIPSGTFEIEDGCSGLRYLLASGALAALYGYLSYARWQSRLLLMAAALSMALLSNWIRVFVVICIGHASQMQSPMIDDHLTFGWILFALFMLPVFFVARRLEINEAGDAAVPQSPHSLSAPIDRQAAKLGVVGTILTIAVMALGPTWAAVARTKADMSDFTPLAFPDLSPGWSGPFDADNRWNPLFAGATWEAAAAYRGNGASVLVYRNHYAEERQDSELVYYRNSVAGTWRIEASSTVAVEGPTEPERNVREVLANDGSRQWLVWYWYEINSRRVVSDTKAKFYQALGVLSGRPGAGLVALATACTPSCADAAFELSGFLADWTIGDRQNISALHGQLREL